MKTFDGTVECLMAEQDKTIAKLHVTLQRLFTEAISIMNTEELEKLCQAARPVMLELEARMKGQS